MIVRTQLVATLFLILTRSHIESKNVIFLPIMVTSHTRIHAFVAEELAKMGHNVWLALPSALEKRNKESYPGVNTFSYNDFWEFSEDMIISNLENTVSHAITEKKDPDWQWVWELDEYFAEVYFQALQDGKLMEFIRSLKPDLLVLDWFPRVDERVAIAYKLKVPFAILSALQELTSAKVPFNPVAEAYNFPHIRHQATLFEQFVTVIQVMAPLFQHLYNDRGYMKQLFPAEPDVPPANELISQAEVYIVESDPIFDYPRPLLPNLKLIGALSVGPAKELQEPFKSFVEKSEKAGVGVAVLSFGSMFMNLHKELETKLISVFKKLKLNVIWRANVTSPDPDKILTSTWIPQNDLLGNKNVKVFITHSGTHSIYEGLYNGVPMVCLPLFYDQFYNAERAVDKGYALNLNLLKASTDELVEAIEHVAFSREMKSTISTASEIYRQLYKNPKQEAAFWLDHVMKYGGSYMRYSGQNLPMYLFVMDYFIVFVAGVLFAIGLILTGFVIKRTFRHVLIQKCHEKSD